MSEADRSNSGWDGARKRLARLAALVDGSAALSRERSAEILARRAQLLARTIEAETPHARSSWMRFTSQGIDCAIELAFVRQVVRSAPVAELPGAPDVFAGVASLRGEIVAVLSLASLIRHTASQRRAPGQLRDEATLLAIGEHVTEFALIADEVHGLVQLTSADVRTVPAAPGDDTSVISGVSAQGWVILSGEKLLSDGRLFVNITS